MSACWVAALILLPGTVWAAVRPAPHSAVSEFLPAEQDAWNRPLRLTRGPGVEFSADYHAARDLLAYVSDRDGSADIFLQKEPVAGLDSPRKLAPHSARDRCPRLDPRGKRLLFVSTREDSAGDIWLLHLRGWFRRPRPRKLTGPQSADDEPCWHPDGERLFYASSPALGARFDLWTMVPGQDPVRLTTEGGQMPDCSPDGRHLVFVSARGSGSPNLWLLRLEDRALAQLTSGPEVDIHPSWSS
ncbi:MAG: TolB family protein, partial [Planctomycetota bacterium]